MQKALDWALNYITEAYTENINGINFISSLEMRKKIICNHKRKRYTLSI